MFVESKAQKLWQVKKWKKKEKTKQKQKARLYKWVK